jgi:peptide-methionine (R)-S-oxide reductase
MKTINTFFTGLILLSITVTACSQNPPQQSSEKMDPVFSIKKTDEEWKKDLTPEQFQVLRLKGTERPFTGKFEDHWDSGMYVCAACGNELFSSDSKFDAGCGWPSFYEALDKTKIIEKQDYTHGMVRTEILCAKCGGHLGHVFDDGPKPTGLRYCVNSVSLDFKKKNAVTKDSTDSGKK